MNKDIKTTANLFKKTAQQALLQHYGFTVSKLSDIEIFDGNSRTEFKFKVKNGFIYQFKGTASNSTIAKDGLNVFIGKNSIIKLD